MTGLANQRFQPLSHLSGFGFRSLGGGGALRAPAVSRLYGSVTPFCAVFQRRVLAEATGLSLICGRRADCPLTVPGQWPWAAMGTAVNGRVNGDWGSERRLGKKTDDPALPCRGDF